MPISLLAYSNCTIFRIWCQVHFEFDLPNHWASSLDSDLTLSIPWSSILATPLKPTVATTTPKTKPIIKLRMISPF